MCPNCRAFVSSADSVCPYCEVELKPRRASSPRRSSPVLGGVVPHAHFTTVLLLTINLGLYLVTVVYSMRSGNEQAFFGLDGRTLFEFGAKYGEAILAGQWWRLVTAGFLHGGLLHILMNSWVLFDLGAQVEDVYGTARFIVFYFFATIFGFYVSAAWNPGLSVGSSAGLFGLIGAMIAFGLKDRTGMGAAVRGLYVRWAIYGLIIGFLPGIDNAAHIGGGIAGFAIAYMAGVPSMFESIGERLWRYAAVACVIITAYCFLQMFFWLTRSGV